MHTPARILLGLSFAALGASSLYFHYAEPTHDPLAMVIRVVLLVGGLALIIPRVAAPASLALAAVLLLRLLVVQLPVIAKHPLIEVNYESLGENMIEIAGAWTVYSMTKSGWLAGYGHVRAGQILFGLALLPIGLSHFFYLDQTAGLIPSWLPFHVSLAYFTGAAHFAAGVAILVGVFAALAATLEAVMVSLFTLVVWVPIVIAAPHSAENWGEICVSAAIAGAAWLVAASLRTRD